MSKESDEIVRADPVYRIRAFFILTMLAAVLAVMSLVYGDPIEAWFDHIRSLSKADLQRAEILVQRTLWGLIALLLLLGTTALLAAAWYARKFLERRAVACGRGKVAA